MFLVTKLHRAQKCSNFYESFDRNELPFPPEENGCHQRITERVTAVSPKPKDSTEKVAISLKKKRMDQNLA